MLVSALSGLGLCVGMAVGELFNGWLRGLVRILSSVITVCVVGWLASIVVRIAQGRPIMFWSVPIVSSALYTLAAGVGTVSGQFWPKRPDIGYLVFGSLGVILMHRLPPLLMVISGTIFKTT